MGMNYLLPLSAQVWLASLRHTSTEWFAGNDGDTMAVVHGESVNESNLIYGVETE